MTILFIKTKLFTTLIKKNTTLFNKIKLRMAEILIQKQVKTYEKYQISSRTDVVDCQ